MLVVRDEIVSIKKVGVTKPNAKDKPDAKAPSQRVSADKPILKEDQPQQVSLGRPNPERARASRNMRPARGNRRIRPMPQLQGRAIADAILIFSKT